MLILLLFAFMVFTLAGALLIHAVWKRRRHQREELERAVQEEFRDEPAKE